MDLFSKVVSSLLLILLSPFLICVYFLCILLQGKPVLFSQTRVGYNYNHFKIYKLRTMVQQNGQIITRSDDVRITNFGKFLRVTKIDEIPQLFNIVKGDMRFIGPRPEVPEYFDKNKFQFLKKIKPGISDISSILLRNENIILDNIGGDNPYNKLLPIKLTLAEYYAERKTFLFDLKLVFVTVISIFSPKFTSEVILLPLIRKDLPIVYNFLKEYLN